jgi:hypothetical protein
VPNGRRAIMGTYGRVPRRCLHASSRIGARRDGIGRDVECGEVAACPTRITPSSVVAPAFACRMPSAISEMVPSPPSAMIRRRPAAASRAAISVACRCALVNELSNSPRPSVMRPHSSASAGQAAPRAGIHDHEGRWGVQPTLLNRLPGASSTAGRASSESRERYARGPSCSWDPVGLGASACWALANGGPAPAW